MYRRSSPAAERVLGLEAASGKLREVLATVLLLAKEDQDQVADAMQGLVQQLLLAARLKALPAGVLAIISHKAGRPIRRASRLLKAAYGPLDCGLRLQGDRSMRDFVRVLLVDPARFSSVTALVLSCNFNGYFANTAEYIGAVSAAFPRLESLSFSQADRMAGPDLTRLAPLASCLTSLAAHGVINNLPAAVEALRPLTALRSLDLPLLVGTAAEVAAMRELSALRSLQQVTLRTPWHQGNRPAATWLPWLSSLTNLTSLAVDSIVSGFDGAAVNMMRTALPQLAALTLLAEFNSQEERNNIAAGHGPVTPASSAEVVAAVAQRTALTSLRLWLTDEAKGIDLRCFSSLQLSKLWLTHDLSDVGAAELLQALSVQSQLTDLHLAGATACMVFDGTAGLGMLAGRLRRLCLESVVIEQFGLFAQHLTQLTELRLAGVVDSSEDGHHTSWLGGLSSLEVLEFGAACSAGCCRALLLEVSNLTQLRDLSVALEPPVTEDDEGEGDVTDTDLWSLLPLRLTLTRLVLGRSQWAVDHLWTASDDHPKAPGVEGPGLGVVGKLSCLKELALVQLAALESPLLLQYLQPLPAGLRRLEVEWQEWSSPSRGVCEGLQAEAALLGCDVQLSYSN